MSKLTQQVAARIKTLRIETDKTAAIVALEAGISEERYLEIESGGYSITLADIERIAPALGVLPTRIFSGCKSVAA